MNKQKKKDELQGSIASITLLSLVQLAFFIPLAWGVFHSENLLLRLGSLLFSVYLAIRLVLQWYAVFHQIHVVDRMEEDNTL